MSVRNKVVLGPAEALERFIEAEVRYFASEGTDMPAFEEMLHPDFVLYEPESLPYGGEWHGVDGFRRFLEVMVEVWSTMGPESPPQLVEQDDTVVVLANLAARARKTDELVRSPVSQVVRVRDGLIVEARMFYWDTLALNRAVGHRPAGEG